MKIIISLILLFTSLSITAQNLEVTAGTLHNKFFDSEQDYEWKTFSDEPAYGFTFNVGYERKFEWLPLRFTLGYENYGGSIEGTEYGHRYEKSVDFEIRKSILTLGVYFINFHFIDNLDLNIGVQFNRLIDESIDGSGQVTVIYLGSEPTITELDYKGKKSNYGLRGRLAYDFNLNDRLAVSPQYDFYYGLSNESGDYPSTVQAYRHYLSVGLQMKLGK